MAGIDHTRPNHSNQPHSCPNCGLSDEIRSVPAVYLAGRDTVSVPGRDGDGRPTTVTRGVTTALSAALAPAPPRAVSAVTRAAGAAGLGMLGVFATLVAIGTFIGGALGGHWFSGDGTGSAAGSEQWTTINGTPTVWINGGPSSAAAAHDSDLAFLGWISGFALLTAVLLFVLAARLAARFRAAMVGRPAAEAVWSRAWYCARCGSVHFPPADGDPTEALSLQQFRALVWEAGGYGALVAQHPAV